MAETAKKVEDVKKCTYIVESSSNQLQSYLIKRTAIVKDGLPSNLNTRKTRLLIGRYTNIISSDQFIILEEDPQFNASVEDGTYRVKKIQHKNEGVPVTEDMDQHAIAAVELTKLSEQDVKQIIQPDKEGGLMHAMIRDEYKKIETRANCAAWVTAKENFLKSLRK